MTFSMTCTAGHLADALNLAAQVAGHQKMMPVLKAVHIVINGGMAEISATNTDHAILTKVAAKGDGEVFVELDLIGAKIAALRSTEPVKIESAADNMAVTVSQGRTRWKVPTLSGDGFPSQFIAVPKGKKVTAKAGPLIHALDVASRAIGNSGLFALDNGVFIDPKNASVIGMSGKMIYVIGEGIPKLPHDLIIPQFSIPAIRTVFGDADEVDIICSENIISIADADTLYVSKLVEGIYPDWRKVFDKNSAKISKAATVDREAFVEALTRATLIREDKLKNGSALGVNIEFSGEECRMNARNKSGDEGEDFCEAITDDAGTIGMNADALQAAIATFGSDRVEVRFVDDDNPIVISEPDNRASFRLVMPYRV